MARYLVTGGAGFIGSHLVDFLLGQGAEVSVLDDLSTGRLLNLDQHEGESRLSFLRGDINTPSELSLAMKGCEVVFHEAALGSVARSVVDPRLTNRVNVEGSLAVLEAARRMGVRRVVLAGSSSVYGDSPLLPKRESMRAQPVSPYAASKAAMEHYALAHHACFGLETVVLRYFNVYGPRQDPASRYAAVIAAFAGALLTDHPCEIHGDGEQSRDFTFVGDVAWANWLAAHAPGAAGGVFNIGSGTRVSVNLLWDQLARLAATDPPLPARGQARAGDVRHTLADISAAAAGLDWRPQVPLAEGLRRTLDWFRGLSD